MRLRAIKKNIQLKFFMATQNQNNISHISFDVVVCVTIERDIDTSIWNGNFYFKRWVYLYSHRCKRIIDDGNEHKYYTRQ